MLFDQFQCLEADINVLASGGLVAMDRDDVLAFLESAEFVFLDVAVNVGGRVASEGNDQRSIDVDIGIFVMRQAQSQIFWNVLEIEVTADPDIAGVPSRSNN